MFVSEIIDLIGFELDGRAVSALGVGSWKLSTGLNGDQNLLSRAPPCFGRHVKLLVLVPVAFAIVSTHSSFKEG
jgi:hypothetical protein